MALTLGLRKTQHSGPGNQDRNQAVWIWNCIGVNAWIFRNKLRIYPDLGYRTWPHHDITVTSPVSGSAYQLVCNSMEAHDLTSPVAGIVGSTWMTQDKIHANSEIAFMIMDACLACSKVKLNYSDIGPRPRL